MFGIVCQLVLPSSFDNVQGLLCYILRKLILFKKVRTNEHHKMNQGVGAIEEEIHREKLRIKRYVDVLGDTFDDTSEIRRRVIFGIFVLRN